MLKQVIISLDGKTAGRDLAKGESDPLKEVTV